MTEPSPFTLPVSAEVHTNLRATARLLREPHRLSPEARQALAEVVGELEHALEAGTVPPEEMAHLRDSTAHLVEALRQQHDMGLFASARNRLSESIVAAEAQAPFTVGFTRRLLDALANIGI
jgi:hypothetical protein